MARKKNGRFSRLQERAIHALITKPTVVEAAAAVGVNRKTIQRWLRDPEFSTEYKKQRRRLVDEAVRELQGAAKQAVKKLIGIMNDESAHNSTRVRAAGMILDYTFKGTEFLDLEQRVESLEAELWEAVGETTLPDWLQAAALELASN